MTTRDARPEGRARAGRVPAVIDLLYHRPEAALLERYGAWTTADEQRHAGGYRRTDDAVAFMAGRALTRYALCRWLGLDPGALELTRVCLLCGGSGHGRPRIVGIEHGPEFSLTRAGGVVAVCVSPGRVGLDAERSQDNVEELIASEVFSEEDRTWVAAGPRRERFLRVWVAKEAIGKASGLGLVEAGAIRLGPPHAGWCPAVDALGAPCSVTAVTIPGAAAAAVATYGQPLSLIAREPPEEWVDAS